MTKAEFEMYRFNVNFPVCNPKLFAWVNGAEFVKTALVFNSFSNSKLMFCFTNPIVRVILSVLFLLLETVNEIARAIFQKCVTPVECTRFFLSLGS